MAPGSGDGSEDGRVALERLRLGLLLIDEHAAARAVDGHVRRQAVTAVFHRRAGRGRGDDVVRLGPGEARDAEDARVAALRDLDGAEQERARGGEDRLDVVLADGGGSDQAPPARRAVHGHLGRRVRRNVGIVVDRLDAARGERPVGCRAHAVAVEAAFAERHGRRAGRVCRS